MRTLTSLMDYSQSAPFLDLSFQFLNFHLLLYVCTQFHLLCTTYVPSCSPLVINPFPLPRSIPLSLTVPRPQLRLSNRIYYNLQPGGPVHRNCNPHLYPQAPGTPVSRILRPAWAAVVLFFSPITTWR